MPVPIADSVGYEGTVTEPEWATLIAGTGGREYGVLDDDAWRARVGTADREVRIGPGPGFGWGVVDRTTDEVSLTLPATASGSAWHLIVVHRDWQNNESSFDTVPAGSTRAIPPRATTPGTADDQPLWLARVDAGKSQVQELVDLRVWGSDGGTFANDPLVRQYLDRLGTSIRIGRDVWYRTRDALGNPQWALDMSGTTDWVPIALSAGWAATRGHTPRARFINGVIWIEGAATRGAGGALASIGRLPEGMRPRKTVFYGASVAIGPTGVAYGELHVDSDGVIHIDSYSNLPGSAGWTVPLSGAFPLEV